MVTVKLLGWTADQWTAVAEVYTFKCYELQDYIDARFRWVKADLGEPKPTPASEEIIASLMEMPATFMPLSSDKNISALDKAHDKATTDKPINVYVDSY